MPDRLSIVSSASFPSAKSKQLRIRHGRHTPLHRQPAAAPKVGGGRQLLTEILGNNLRTRETIAIGEGEHRSFYEIIEASSPFGWMTFDPIDPERLRERSHHGRKPRGCLPVRKGRVSRGLDLIQKARGVDNDLDSGLRLDLPAKRLPLTMETQDSSFLRSRRQHRAGLCRSPAIPENARPPVDRHDLQGAPRLV